MKTLRKSVAVLMALAVSLTFFAVSCDTKPTGDESSEFVQQYVTGTETGVTDGTAPALEYELNATNAKILGRSSTAKGGHTFSYGSAGFSVRFTGSEFWMYVPETPMENNAVRKVGVAVLVDTDMAMDAKMIEIDRTGWLKVAEGLSEGEHEIQIRKQSRGFFGMMQSDWFRVTKYGTVAGSAVKTAEPLSDLIIEVYGDSISNGDAVWKNENGTNSAYTFGNYTGVLERLLDAEVRVSANTGNGLLGWCLAGGANGRLDNLYPPQKSWDKYDPWVGIDEDYSHAGDNQTDVVIINLGTNDRVEYNNGDMKDEDFNNEYLRFVKQIKTDCPGAIVICTIGAMGGMPEFGDNLPQIARDANAWAGETFCYFFELQSCSNSSITGGYGYDNSHPSNLAHEIYGLQLAHLINGALGLNKDLPTDVPASAYNGTVEGNIMNAVTKKEDNLSRVQDALELKNLQ